VPLQVIKESAKPKSSYLAAPAKKAEPLPVNLAFKGDIKKDNAPLRVKDPSRISNGNANALPSALPMKGGGMMNR